MKIRTAFAIILLLAGLAAFVGYLDNIDFIARVSKRVSAVVYEINAFNALASAVQHVCVAVCALAGALWLFKRRNPRP